MTVTLEPWRREFAPSIARYADNPRVADNLRDIFPCPYALSDAEAYIEECLHTDDSRELRYAIVVDGEAAGSITVTPQADVYRRSAELGYWLGEPFWGRGIMTRAVRQACEEAFGRYDIVRIYAEPYAYNRGSRRVLEKAGFTLEGVLRQSVTKNGQLYDSCIYARLRGEGT